MDDKKFFLRKHKRKIVTSAPIIFLLLLGGSGILAGGNTLTLAADKTIFAEVGDEMPITLSLTTKTPVNAAGGTVTFPADIMQVDSLERTSSIIDLWSEEPTTSNTEGSIRFSGGIIGPHVGEKGNHGPIFTVHFHALASGKATLRIKNGELLANDGTGDNQISSTGVLTVYVRAAGRMSPDVNDDGVLSLSDVNSLYLQTFRTFDERYDLNGDGVVSWSDVRLLIALL